jgi:hypothetical protein
VRGDGAQDLPKDLPKTLLLAFFAFLSPPLVSFWEDRKRRMKPLSSLGFVTAGRTCAVGCPTWIRTTTKGSKDLCATFTPSDKNIGHQRNRPRKTNKPKRFANMGVFIPEVAGNARSWLRFRSCTMAECLLREARAL